MLKQATYFLASLIILLAIFAGGERTSSPFFQSCISEQQNSKSDAATKNQPSGYGTIVTSYVNCSGQFIERHGVGITALATFMIAAFTCTLWLTSSTQAKLTKEALIADKSAFVFPYDFGQYWEFDITSLHYNWRVRPYWRNTGDTAAKDVMVHAECEIRNTALPVGHPFNYSVTNEQRGFMGPRVDNVGGIAPAMTQAAITAQDLVDAQAQRKFIYLWGWTRYNDVFPNTPRHITKFCWLIQTQGDPLTFIPNTVGPVGTPGTLTFSYSQHSEGNSAEDE
jgi:hypothetical protein